MFALLLCATPSASQQVNPNLWGTNGAVSTIARSGNTIYVGGSFTMVGPNTGGGVPVDRVTGEAIKPFPQVAGVVNAVVGDGNGGWFIGGTFVAVGGVLRTNLAHILAGGGVSDWAPNPDGVVLALARRAGTVYTGGSFSQVGGQARSNIAALDAATGEATDWDPAAGAQVRALLWHAGRLYVGGHFASIGGQPRNSLAELDPMTGAATEWNPNVGWDGWPGAVDALAARGDTVYVGGNFGMVGLLYRGNVAAVDATTGLATAWNPSATGPDDSYYGNPYVRALALSGSTILVGGHFTGIGGQVRGGLAEIDLETGFATAWNPDPGPWFGVFNRDVTALVATQSTILVAGYFESIGGRPRNFIAEVDRETGVATDWNPNANYAAMALAVRDGAVYIGGGFTGLGPEWQRRMGLMALDATTGRPKDWNPDPNGFGILDLVLSHGRLYVSGLFSTIGGQVRDGLAALDTLTGAATDWYPTTNNWTVTLEAAGDTLYVGGLFTAMSGMPRNRLASFNLMTGELTAWDPNANSDVNDLTVSGNTVYIAGFFSSIGGITRRYGIAAVDVTTGAVADWNPQSDNWVGKVIVVGNTVFVGGRFDTIGGQSRANLAALDPATGLATGWVANTNSHVYSLATIADTLYVGGSFFTIGGEPRSGLAALDIKTGTVLPWDPDLSSVEWCSSCTHPVVWSLAAAGSTLYVGGRFGRTGGVPAASLTAFSFPAPPPAPGPVPRTLALAPIAPNPVRASATVRFALPTAAVVTVAVFDVQGRRVASLLDHALRPAGTNEVAVRAEGWPEGLYLCRVEAGGMRAVGKFVVHR